MASLKCRGWSAGALGPGRWGGCAGLSALAIVGVRSPGLALLGFRLCVPQPSSSSAQGSCYRCLHGMVLTRNGNIPGCSAPSALLGFSDEKQCSLTAVLSLLPILDTFERYQGGFVKGDIKKIHICATSASFFSVAIMFVRTSVRWCQHP